MFVYWLDKETKQYMGQGNDTDIDLGVSTHIEMLQTEIEPSKDFEYIDEVHCIIEYHPFRWNGTGWELI